MSSLSLSLLGAPRFARDGAPLKFDTRKNMALVAYLAVTALSSGGQQPGAAKYTRESLIALLWPELDPSRARAGLRRNLSTLKRSLGGVWLVVEGDTVGTDPGADFWLDIAQFRSLLQEWQAHGHPESEVCPLCLETLADAVDLYQGDFLQGFGLRDSANFDEWQFFQTEGLRQELASALERLVRGHTAQGRPDRAIPFARRWLALDPLHEPVHRHLMQLYAQSGQRAAALRQYSECQRVLEEELGASPEEETVQLVQAIQEKRDLPPEEPGPSTARAGFLNNRYRLGAEIGRGGTAVVYRAHDVLLDRDVAVKVFAASSLDPAGRARLLYEAQAAAKLSHPNIIAVYDAGEADGRSFIVMERVDGKSLYEDSPTSLDEILSIAQQICGALAHAHTRGIVHRDLKPENVVGTVDGQAKLADFGLARPVASRITSVGLIAGTVFYLAPELALGQAFDGRADLYALGVMLYEWMTSHLPFTADDPMAVISQHLHAPVVPPRAWKPELPPALDSLIVQLLNKDPAERPASANEVLERLEAPDLLDQPIVHTDQLTRLKRIGRSRLVGRTRELGEARALWDLALAGQGQVLLVSGEAGVGKTRLARELTTQVQVLGGRVLVGACYAEGGSPYAPFAQILSRALEASSDGGLVSQTEESTAGLRHPASSQRTEVVPEFVLAGLLTLVPALRLNYPDLKPEPPLDDPRAEQYRLFGNLSIFFAALSDRTPLLLVLEDLHWADSGSLALLRHLARHAQGRRLMILATHREVGPDQAAAFQETMLDLGRERLAGRLRLGRLNREHTEEMLAALLAEEITPEFLDGIYGETEGNPFYVEEVCKALVESGKLYYQNGRWDRPSIKALGIPQSVQVAIQSRVRVLPTDTQDVLRLAAVLGRQFDFDTLAQACGEAPTSYQGEGDLIEALEISEQAQLIEEIGGEDGGTFSFVHALIPATLAESTRTLQRRRLHGWAANAIETQRPDDLEALAHHYSQAGEAEKAADYLLQAGDRARRLYALQEAAEYYRQALVLLKKAGDLERAARTQMKLGLTYHNAFDFKAAREAYQEGFDFWQRVAHAESVDLPAPHALRVTAIEPATLSPGKGMELPSAVIIDQLFSGLVEVSPEMGVVPDVAHSWQVLDGGRKYVFHLRNDVFWSDGIQVTAHDFEYACRRTLDPARHWKAASLLFDIQGARAYHHGELADPEQVGVHALDELTLAVALEGPSSYFPFILAFSPMFAVPRHVVQLLGEGWADGDSIVTNGPFRLVAWERGESIVLERNPTYHGHFTGNLQRVECSFVSGEPGRLLQMYGEDRLDICADLPPALMSRARHQFAGEYISGPRLSIDLIGFDVSRPPFDDRRVRQAFALATDRETLADVTLRGYAFPATGGLVPPGMAGHSPGIGLPHDPEAARQLLAEAGYPGGHGFPDLACIARDDPGHGHMCEYLQAQWRENLGVEMSWEEIEWARFPGRMDESVPHMWMVGYWADYPDPDDYLRIMWWLPSGWLHPVYDQLVEDARRAVDQVERMKLYAQADRILIEEVSILPLTYARFHVLVKPWVRKYLTPPLRWWFWRDVVLEPH